MFIQRRNFLKLLGIGLATPFSTLAQAGYGLQKNLIIIEAQGGLRAMDIFDAHSPGIYGTQVVNTPYLESERTHVQGDWYLPPWGAALTDHTSNMAIIRNVFMESAAHAPGRRLGSKGVNRTNAPAGSVLVTNKASYAFGPTGYAMRGLSFPHNQPAGNLTAPVAGEPADLASLFLPGDLSGDPVLNAALASKISQSNTAYKQNVMKDSPSHPMMKYYEESLGMKAGTLAQSLDPDYGAYAETGAGFLASANYPVDSTEIQYARRFASAFKALKYNLSPVVNITLNGFDTHSSHKAIQEILCQRLANFLDVLISAMKGSVDQQNQNIFDKTVILVTSDFGRTPHYNATGGTDHWISDSVALFAGSATGIQAGSIGPRTAYPMAPGPGSVIRRRDIWASIFRAFGISNYGKYLPDAQHIPQLTP